MARRVAPLLLPGLALAVGLALPAASGCGKSKEKQLFEQRRADCSAIRGKTLGEAEQLFSGSESGLVAACDTSQARLPGDTCAGASGPYTQAVCQWVFAWLASDPDLCNGYTGNCVYYCEARLEDADLAANGTGAVICGNRFVDPK